MKRGIDRGQQANEKGEREYKKMKCKWSRNGERERENHKRIKMNEISNKLKQK